MSALPSDGAAPAVASATPRPLALGLAIGASVRNVKAKLWLLIAGVVASAIMGVVSLYTFGRQNDAAGEIPAAIEVRRQVRVMVIDTLSAETAQRGYLLTGDRRYLDDFLIWKPRAAVDRLLDVVSDAQRGAVGELAEELESKRAEMEATVRLYDEGAKEQAHRLISSNLGKKFMDDARALMAQIIEHEDVHIRGLLEEVNGIRRFALPLVVGGTGVTVLGLLIGLVTISRSTAELEAMAKRDADQANRLEEQSLTLSAGLVAAGEVNRALMRSNRDLDQFAYVASHDLKAPLRAIASLSTWIEEDLGDGVDDRTREHLRLMRSRVDRMSSLIEGILGYSRAGRDGQVTVVATRQAVREVYEGLMRPDGVRVEVLDGAWPTGKTQRVQLQQVWQNLIGNAFKHGVPKGGLVQLGCERCDATKWTFWVHDDGLGIDAAYHARIFDLFQRLASRDQVEGAGIGLSIVRKLVDTNGGRIWIESEPGAGTTFKFTWSFHDVA